MTSGRGPVNQKDWRCRCLLKLNFQPSGPGGGVPRCLDPTCQWNQVTSTGDPERRNLANEQTSRIRVSNRADNSGYQSILSRGPVRKCWSASRCRCEELEMANVAMPDGPHSSGGRYRVDLAEHIPGFVTAFFRCLACARNPLDSLHSQFGPDGCRGVDSPAGRGTIALQGVVRSLRGGTSLHEAPHSAFVLLVRKSGLGSAIECF